MDTTARLKIKVGIHEFEAEGPSDIVQSQFEAFKDLIAYTPIEAAPYPQIDAGKIEIAGTIPTVRVDAPQTDAALGKIMRVDSRVISLTARPKVPDDAVLLLLYGQKILRENDSVTGAEIIDGLTATGGLQLGRVDRLLEKAGRD